MKNIFSQLIGGKAGRMTDKNDIMVVLMNFLLNYVPEAKRDEAQKELLRVCRLYQIDSLDHYAKSMRECLDDLCPEA